MILLENTSGIGSSLGYNCNQLKYIEDTDTQTKWFVLTPVIFVGYNLADEEGTRIL